VLDLLLKREMDRLIKWLTEERGLEIVERGLDYVNCRDGNNSVHYRYIYMDIPSEADIAKSVAELAGNRGGFNKMYIAIDKSALNFIDGKLMKKLGIGVIVMGEEIREALPSIPIATIQAPIMDGEELQLLERTIRAMQDKINQLEKRIQELEERSKRFDGNAVEKRQEEKRIQEENPAPAVTSAGDVPQFMKENPWLDILGKRSNQ
jgi:hypothetical protein